MGGLLSMSGPDGAVGATMPDRSPEFVVAMDHLVRGIGHVILMKVDPAAARALNLRSAPEKRTNHEMRNPWSMYDQVLVAAG